ncbi:patatin [Acidithiobacillus thiooxidans]|uniref:Patatin n=1 Tax=Acidithiobacillus thiooxidans TaxID=930 RepID=A0A1C2JCF9_ACITH|nr:MULTISPECIES: patatin-like phospholipase family protein [Acidithiobacillus]MBU2743550.1 patatin [Acidithiobacillus albertensis]MBU2794875.1 patatin [Acidithiobacillus thiooxidans]MBU2843302.1 patatin [Acidithiobacillus thiooxidans]OCX72770.1 patatin [Acidithiobacillus thiooxidans]OCX73899.1 patatin [Acidithiobacillus thiooxidans]
MTIGLALGSGAARGWAHIGVINALNDQGIVPDIVCGTSIGALVGASYVSNNLGKLEKWVCSLTKLETAKFFSIKWSLNGFVNKERLHYFLNKYVADDDSKIEALVNKTYASVATDLQTGSEIWLTNGSILDAVISSISMPGLFPAVKNNGRWLIDGGLVNPVPVSVCRALGADTIIAVTLNDTLVREHHQNNNVIKTQDTGITGKISDLLTTYTASIFPTIGDEDRPPSLFDTISASVNIMQDRIIKSRIVDDPPDILLSPRLSHIGLLEFYRADEAIAEGKKYVQSILPEIQRVLGIF